MNDMSQESTVTNSSVHNSSSTKNDDNIDILNRQPIIDRIINILHTISANDGTCTFALNGKWGSGKTFVLKMLESQLLDYEPNEGEKPQKKYLVLNYNCWQYDFYEEPLMAITASIFDSIKDHNNNLSKNTLSTLLLVCNTAIEVFGKYIENKVGFNISEIAKNSLEATENEIEKGTEFDKYSDFKEALNNMRKALISLAKEYTIIITVDELDRCVPIYAIKVLERLHHLFNGLSSLIVLIAVDKEQLKHTIHQLFGPDADPDKYLEKFINFEICLDYGTVSSGFEEKFNDYISLFDSLPANFTFDINQFASTLFNGIDIRLLEQIMHKIKIAHMSLFANQKKDYSFMCYELLCGICEIYYGIDPSSTIAISTHNNGIAKYDCQYANSRNNDIKSKRKSSSFASLLQTYLNDNWAFLLTTAITTTNRLYRPAEINLPQILVYYLYHTSNMEAMHTLYGFAPNTPNLEIYKSNVEDLIKFKQFLRLIQ